MKKILSAILCIMLLLTTLPMVALATEEETFDTIGDVVEKYAGITDYNPYAYWSMTEKISSGTYGFTYTPHNAAIDPEKGTYISSSTGTDHVFRYNSGIDYWSPLETGKRFVYFKAQVSETDKLEIYVEDTQGLHQHGSFTITATEFGEINFGGLYYAREGGAGTEMLEYLIVNDYPNIVKLFAKGEITGDKWVLAANAHTWGGNNENRGLYFTGTGYVKDVTLYDKTVTYASADEIAGKTLYSTPSYELNTETTIETGQRYTGPIGPAIEKDMVPVFCAKLDDADSSMHINIRKLGETSATYNSYEFTVAADGITSNAPLTYLNTDFNAGTDYVDYALLLTETECKAYARSDSQYDGKWVHIVTDRTASSTDNSYCATPAIWATTGSFTVQNLRICQPMASYDTIEEVVGLESVIATKRFDLTQAITDKTGFAAAPTGATVDVENGTLIDSSVTNGIFRYNNGDDVWSSLETGKRFAYFTAKAFEDQSLEVYLQNVDGLPSRGSFKISATEFIEGGFVNDTEYSRAGGAGTDWVEYLLVSTNANYVNLYAKSPSLTNDKWVLACTASGWAGTNEKSNGLYFTGKGYVKEAVLYEKLETYESLDAIAGEALFNIPDYEKNEEVTTATGERYTGPIGPAVTEGMVSVVRAKLDDEASSMRVILRKPGETAANTTCYEFTVTPDTITSNATLAYLNEAFQAGTDYVEYALFATATECKVYARSESQFDGKWVHVVTDLTAYSTDTSYYATPAIWATTGSFTVNNLKVYQTAQPAMTYDSINSILGYDVRAARSYDLTTSNYGEAASPAALETGVGVNMNDGGYWRVGGDGKSALGTDKAIYFRAKAEEGKNSYFYLHIPDETKTEATYCFMLNENGIGTTDNNTHKAYCYEAGGSHVEFAPGTEFAEYLAVDYEDGTGLHIYARQEGLYDGEWIETSRIVGYYPSLSAKSEFYMTSNGTLSAVKMYEKAVFYATVDEVVGESVIVTKTFDDFMRYTPNSTYSPLTNGAVTFNATACEDGKAFRVYIHDPNTEKNAYAFKITKDGLFKTTDNAPQNIVMSENFVPGTEAHDYLVVENASKNGVLVYVKNTEGKWAPIFEITGHTLDTPYSDTYGLYIFNNEEGSKAVLHSAAIYAAANTEDVSNTIPEGATNLYFEDDFSGSREYKATKSGSAVADGVLTIEEMGYYTISGITIPAGGYAEFKLTGNDITELYIGDSTSRFNWNLGSADSTERIWRIVRSADGGQYTGYWCPADNQTAWVKGFEEAVDTIEDGKTKLEFSNNGTGSITVDYLKIYVPDSVMAELVGEEAFVLVDGMGNNALEIAGDSVSAEYKTTTILVKQDADAKILLIAEHDNRGVLSKLTRQEVPAGERVTSLIYDASAENVRVFLWDGEESITNLMNSISISYAK